MIVTVSRAYGASALAVSRRAAELLGYRLVDEQLPVIAGARLGMPAEVVETVAERPRPFAQRVLEQLGGGVPETSQPPSREDELSETRRAIEDALRENAAAGDCVIVGRMGGAILGARPDVLRIYACAPLAARVAHVMESLRVGEAAARAEVTRIDEARRAYARDGYRVAWGDPRNYDLVLDTSRFGIEGSAELIAAAVRLAEG